MPTAYILINCETETQDKILNQLKKVPGIVEVSEVNGDSLKQTITQHIRTIKTITSTMTLIETK
jgi:hypothetical protein